MSIPTGMKLEDFKKSFYAAGDDIFSSGDERQYVNDEPEFIETVAGEIVENFRLSLESATLAATEIWDRLCSEAEKE